MARSRSFAHDRRVTELAHGGQCMAVIGLAKQRLHMGDELANGLGPSRSGKQPCAILG